MAKLRRIAVYSLLALLLLVFPVALGGWWTLHRALPQLDGSTSLPGLKHEVIVDRDALGVPTLRADALEDLVAAQGYVLAQDRLWQMDILRRAAAGELSEILGPATLELDRENRTLGLRVAAERAAAGLDGAARAMLEAYARGVNHYIEERRGRLSWEFVALRYKPRPWALKDTILVSGYMYKLLTAAWKSKLNRARVTERVGPERARELFVQDSPLDRFIVGGQAERGKPSALKRESKRARRSEAQQGNIHVAGVDAPQARPEVAPTFSTQFEEGLAEALGSNNWVVDGTHTASGKPLLANDTHLPLGVPDLWYQIHLKAPGWNVKGFALPGVPLVIIGHNERIAWGFTNNGADVQDLYIERFNPGNPQEYRVNGRWVPAEIRKETIHVRGRADEVLDVVLTRHGPIVYREKDRAYALRWTATEPDGMTFGFPLLGRARNWAEFREASRFISGPAQNAVYADVDGNIGFIVAAHIPVRKNGTGALPVPGETEDYEWTGYIPFEELPQALNPPGGIIATANARVAGPGYSHYLTDRWVGPYRTSRIYELLEQKKLFRPQDFTTIQTDLVSLPHRFLAEQLMRASETPAAARGNRPRDPRARELLARLAHWDGRAEAGSAEMAFLEAARIALMRSLLKPVLGGELGLYQWWRDGVFLENVLRERPSHWLPKEIANYDELLLASADEVVKQLESSSRSAEPSRWRWGRFIPLEILHPLGRTGLLRRILSIGPLEQGGAGNTVKQTGRAFGPAMRFVADLADFDNSLANVTVGQSGQVLSPNYRDEFPAWLEGRGVPSPFSDAAEEKARVHRLRLVPR